MGLTVLAIYGLYSLTDQFVIYAATRNSLLLFLLLAMWLVFEKTGTYPVLAQIRATE